MIKIKNVLFVSCFVICSLIGWRIYTYFFDRSIPELSIFGLEANNDYCGDIPCVIKSTKSGHISVFLDGQALVTHFKMVQSANGQPFTIPTKTLSNGSHALKAQFTDNTFNKNDTSLEYSFNVDNLPLQAALVKSDVEYKVLQGRTLHVQFQVNKPIKTAKLKALSQEYDCFAESPNSQIYECFVPISCEEQPNEYLFAIDMIDGVGNSLHLDNKFQVVMFPFKKQTLAVSPEKIREEQEQGLDIKRFEDEIEKIVNNSPKVKLWKGNFCAPIDPLRITGDFGTIRTTQHKGRYAHKAVDIANQPRGTVWTSQDGIVVMKDRFAHSGNTIAIDHGYGIISLYFHLDSFADYISAGTKIAKGNPIGTIGKTGFANGYHLHWEMRINNIAVDPMQWIKPIF
jgi:hypothetical protein